MKEIMVEAVFENGVFRPSQPVSLTPSQVVTLIVQIPQGSKFRAWPDDTAQIYKEIAEEDRRLAESMASGIAATWPTGEEKP